MSNEWQWREAFRVRLSEPYTLLTGRGGKSADPGILDAYESDTFYINGDMLGRLFDLFGFEISGNLYKEGISVNRIPATNDGDEYGPHYKDVGTIERIDARILAPTMVELKITYIGGYLQEISYCGHFMIEWLTWTVEEEKSDAA